MNASRRSFLTAAAAAPVAFAVPASNAAETTKWDRTVDFLIIGTGFAGYAAALEAH